MRKRNAKKLKPIQLLNQEALYLVYVRANREGRSRSNALAQTIKEALGHKPALNPGFQQSHHKLSGAVLSIAKPSEVFGGGGKI